MNNSFPTAREIAAQMQRDQFALGVCETRCLEVNIRYSPQATHKNGDALEYMFLDADYFRGDMGTVKYARAYIHETDLQY